MATVGHILSSRRSPSFRTGLTSTHSEIITYSQKNFLHRNFFCELFSWESLNHRVISLRMISICKLLNCRIYCEIMNSNIFILVRNISNKLIAILCLCLEFSNLNKFWCIPRFVKWCPLGTFRVLQFLGSKEERQQMKSQEFVDGKFDVVVTSYDIVSECIGWNEDNELAL